MTNLIVDLPGEVWKPIPRWSGLYCLSTHGRVMAVAKKTAKKNGTVVVHLQAKLLKPGVTGNGYLGIQLHRGGICSKHYVHRLVLETFVGPCPPGMEACHNDGDRKNNSVANLRWDTRKNNHADKRKHGTSGCGEHNHNAKLTKSQVVEMRKQRADTGVAFKKLGAMFGVTEMAAYYICKRTSWAHVR